VLPAQEALRRDYLRRVSTADLTAPAAAPDRRDRLLGRLLVPLGVVIAVVVAAAIALALNSGQQPPDTVAATLMPADALAYVNVSADPGRDAVKRGLAVARGFPIYGSASTSILGRLSAIVSGGARASFATDIKPWLGDEVALGVLNTTTATAGSLTLLSVSNRARALAFLQRSGATAVGAYRGIQLLHYPTGTELAFIKNFLALGQDASVRAAIDVSEGAAPSLASAAGYSRAAAGEPDDRVLDAYISAAGVRRLLTPRGGALAALATLIYSPALEGVTLSISPQSNGARLRLHSALDPTLARLSHTGSSDFKPTLPGLLPSGSQLLFDVSGLANVAPRVLSAVAMVGIGGQIEPLLARLGSALAAEGVNVHAVSSLFSGENAVAITSTASLAPALTVITRTSNEASARQQLAQLEVPLSQLFPAPSSGPGQAPLFNDIEVDGVTVHRLSLTQGLQLNYAVFNGLAVLSTSRDGIASVISHQRSLADDPQFKAATANRPARVTSLLFLDFRQLLSLGEQIGLTGKARLRALLPDLQRIRAVGLSSTSGEADTTAELSIQTS
jgi:hypothetical protein